MARRGRVIGVTIGLLVGFLLITSRHRNVSHPRDLHANSHHNSQEPQRDVLRPIINEPAGKWDPVEDRFEGEKVAAAGGDRALQEQLDDIAKQPFDLPAEGIQRKTPKKEAKKGHGVKEGQDRGSGINPQGQGLKGAQQKAGSGAVVVDSKQEVLKEFDYTYDPAEGSVC